MQGHLRKIGLFGFIGIGLLPIFFLIFKSFDAEWEVLKPFFEIHWFEILWQSLGLGGAIAFVSSGFGVVAGYICARFDFPGRRIWQLLLMTPLAVPLYIHAFVYSGHWQNTFGFSQPGWLPFLVFGAGSFPYAFLLSLQAFKRIPAELLESSHLLGLSRFKIFTQIEWPLSRPMILTSFFIILSEYLADFGAASLLGLNTFSLAIYRLWNSYYSLGSASVVSLILMVIILGLLWVQGSFKQFELNSSKAARRIQSGSNFPVQLFFIALFSLGFGIPCLTLIHWSQESWERVTISTSLLNTLTVGGLFSILLTALVLFLVFQIPRKNKWLKPLTTFFQFGYSLPGTLVAVAVVIPFFYLQRIFPGFSENLWIGLLLIGLAWTVRFLKVSWEPISKQKESIPASLEETIKILNLHWWKRWFLVRGPLIKDGLLASALFLFLEAAKELPIALLSRPAGWNNLTTHFFQFAAESDWQMAAPFALSLIGICSFILATILIIEEKHA